MIFGYGIYELATGTTANVVQLTNLHTPVWWGGMLLAARPVSTACKFRPGRASELRLA